MCRLELRHVAPRLGYGRHFGPGPNNARPAAVLILLYRDQGEWHLPLIVRPDTMSDHAGQVSLPGGVVEPGETSAQCAIREFEEELGDSIADAELLGTLPPVWVFVSNFLVTPHVARLDRRPAFRANPTEVAQVIEFPLPALFDPAARGRHVIARGPLRFNTPHLRYAGHEIWGATCLILAEFAAQLSDLKLSMASSTTSL